MLIPVYFAVKYKTAKTERPERAFIIRRFIGLPEYMAISNIVKPDNITTVIKNIVKAFNRISPGNKYHLIICRDPLGYTKKSEPHKAVPLYIKTLDSPQID